MVHLSSNERVTARKVIAVEDDEGLPDDAATSLPLRYHWIVWEQLMASGSKSIQYSESTRRIASCDNVEDFWQTCVRLPQPSELLSNRMAVDVADRFRTIDARMFFREGTHHSGRMRPTLREDTCKSSLNRVWAAVSSKSTGTTSCWV